MSDPIAIVPSRVPFLDPRTGDISRQWYLLILSIVNRLGGVTGLNVDDVALGTLTGNTAPNLDAMLQLLSDAQNAVPAQIPPSSADLDESNVLPSVPDFRIQDDVTPTYVVGTMGEQNADRVAIKGGAIDGTAIGVTSTSTGKFTTLTAGGGVTLMVTSTALANGAAAAAGTLANAPVAGNPTKWIGINDNGTVRYIPAW